VRIALLDWVCDPARPAVTGLSDIVWDLARRLAAEGDDVTIIGAYDRSAVPPTDIPLVRIDRPRAWQRNVLGQVLTVLSLARATSRIRPPDVFFAPEYISIAALNLYHPTRPGVFTTPGNIFERIAHGNPYDWATTQVYKVAALIVARRAARIVALSRQMRDWWRRTGASAERVVVVPLGIDTGVFRPLEGARARLGIPADEEMILYAGRFSIEKNLPTLVSAVAALARRRPRLRLRLVGGGPDEAVLRRMVASLGAQDAVELINWVPKEEIPDYYRAADVFTLPSTSEPLARALLEAIGCGTFTLASASGGTPDVIRSGENGLLVEAQDVAAWEAAIERAFLDPGWRRRLADQGRSEVHAHFNWPTITHRLREEALLPAARVGMEWRRRSGARPARPTPPRVFFVDYVLNLERPGASGLSDIVWDMATELVCQGGEAHVFGPYAQSPRPSSGVELHTFPIPPPGYRNVLGHIAMVLSALREIRRFGRPGIIHAPEYLSTGIIALLARDLPTVLTVPGSIYEKIATGNNPYDATMTPVLRLAARLSARYCACVVATSAEMERWWRWTGTAPHRLERIPLGVDLSRFGRRPDARARLGISPDDTVLLGVGRLNRENGLTTLISALPGVVRRFPRLRLLIAGSGPDLGQLQRQAERLGVAERISWLGWIDSASLATYYSAADLFVFTAQAAGLPRVMLEAMACGAPVVASAISGVTDHIVDRVTGYLVPPRSPVELEARIVEALASPERSAVGAAGQRHVHDDLTWARVVEELIMRVYRPLQPALAR